MPPSAPGRIKNGGRAVTIALIASVEMGVGNSDRPMVDETWIATTVDFNLEWQKVSANLLPGEEPIFDEDAPNFQKAVEEQLGLKFIPHEAVLQQFVVDHLERADPN